MAKEEAAVENTDKITLTIGDGIRFGLGSFIVNAAGFAVIGVVAWLVIIATRYFGLAF